MPGFRKKKSKADAEAPEDAEPAPQTAAASQRGSRGPDPRIGMPPQAAVSDETLDDDELADDEEGDEAILLDCPTCGEVQAHDLLRMAASGWTVSCLVCQNVRTLPAPAQERYTAVPAILSDGATARTVELAVPLDGAVRVDDEFDYEGSRVRITSVETRAGTRPTKAPGRDVKVLYAVKFDTVLLRYTVNQGDVTRSFREPVPPEEEVHVGTVREVQGINLLVKTLKSDQNRTLHRGFLYARNIRRVFADLAPAKARSGQRVATRRRGADPRSKKHQARRGK